MHFTTVVPLLAAAALVAGAPQPIPTNNKMIPRAIAFNPAVHLGPLTVDQVIKAYPETKSCDKPPFGPHECDTAAVAVPLIELAYKKFNTTTFGQKAALLSNMVLESASFKANINHSQNRPGQGTKAMLMFNFIVEYVKFFPELQYQFSTLGHSIPADLTFDTIDKVDPAVQTSVRALVLGNEYTYGAAPWYLTKSAGCPKDTSAKLAAGGWSGFEYYVTKCINAGSTVAQDRKDKWCAAVKALLPTDMSPPPECP